MGTERNTGLDSNRARRARIDYTCENRWMTWPAVPVAAD